MPLELREVKEDSEFDELVRCECESFQEPLGTFFRLFRPDPSPTGFIELRDRQIRWHHKDPTSRWFKVVDSDIDDKVVGAANWNTFLANPYVGKAGQPMEAEWWDEGGYDS